MGPFRKLLLVGVSVLALGTAAACAADDLNPQPLPPEDNGGGAVEDPGAGGSGNPAPADSADASGDGGDGGDASDAGADR